MAQRRQEIQRKAEDRAREESERLRKAAAEQRAEQVIRKGGEAWSKGHTMGYGTPW